jgi:hypothetical protein
MVFFNYRISLYLDDLSMDDRGLLTFPTTGVLGSICDYKSINVCLMKLSAYKLIIVIST